MHRLLIVACAIFTAGCTTTSQPLAVETRPAVNSEVAAVPSEPKKPQCYSSETSRFHDIGDKTDIAGVKVFCALSADQKFANWSTGKH